MRTLFLDCFSGISGDMSVAALCDLGLPTDHLRSELSKLGLDAEFHFHTHRESRQNIEGVRFKVHPTLEKSDHDHTHTDHSHSHSHAHPLDHHHEHAHSHAHDHAHGRSFRQIRALIAASDLSEFVKTKSLATFHRVAVAEGKIHGMPPDDVTFHEVGAIDSIVDIVAFCIGLEHLGVEQVTASSLVEGSGFIQCAHGRFPLPAPATLEILAGIPLAQCDEPHEFITPTGAAIIAEFSNSFGPMPRIRTEKIGYGVGSRDTAHRPNVLRAVLGTSTTETPAEPMERIIQVETHWDDFSPELAAPMIDRLLKAGALDAFLTPIQMKKSRPGLQLTAICPPELADSICEILLRETPTLGVRFSEKSRKILAREFHEVETPFGKIRIKVALASDGTPLHSKPEFESVKAAADAANTPLQTVYQAAIAAAAIT